MEPLSWHFDWATRRTVASSQHGTYTIVGEGARDWSARFIHLADDGTPGDGSLAHYGSMADAMHACHRHAETYSPTACCSLRTITPLPER